MPCLDIGRTSERYFPSLPCLLDPPSFSFCKTQTLICFGLFCVHDLLFSGTAVTVPATTASAPAVVPLIPTPIDNSKVGVSVFCELALPHSLVPALRCPLPFPALPCQPYPIHCQPTTLLPGLKFQCQGVPPSHYKTKRGNLYQ